MVKQQPEKLSAAQQRSIDWIKAGRAKELGALGIEIGKLLADLVVEAADAKRERDHWKQACETISDEIKVIVSVCIAKLGGSRLTITKQEYFDVVKGNVELFTSMPDGMRMYELRERRKKTQSNKVDDAVSRIIRPN